MATALVGLLILGASASGHGVACGSHQELLIDAARTAQGDWAFVVKPHRIHSSLEDVPADANTAFRIVVEEPFCRYDKWYGTSTRSRFGITCTEFYRVDKNGGYEWIKDWGEVEKEREFLLAFATLLRRDLLPDGYTQIFQFPTDDEYAWANADWGRRVQKISFIKFGVIAGLGLVSGVVVFSFMQARPTAELVAKVHGDGG